jgi:UDP-glucose 4-epimerase
MNSTNGHHDSRVLVTGGAGYIGSHVCLELLENNFKLVVIDNLRNSSSVALKRVSKLTNKSFSENSKKDADLIFFKSDINDENVLKSIFNDFNISVVMHFAGLKAVNESIKYPLDYYLNNVVGSITLFKTMAKARVKKIVFSSSATVYGSPKEMPITENFPTGNTLNPYGQTKYVIEDILKDIGNSDKKWKICILRYFNPVGAHSSGYIGEDPNGIPNNLMPYISQVAARNLKKLSIYGDSYPTRDGTGVRDYIHVTDLAIGHIAALKYIMLEQSPNINIFNLGTGKGTSVLELLNAFQEVTGKEIPYSIVAKREGDVAESWTSTKLIESVLGWSARYDIFKMCEDTWRWQSNNPNGYKDKPFSKG